MNYDVIIIGAGPGGIFAAYELMQQKPTMRVAVFEAGHALDKRHCPIDGDKIKSCVSCKSCSIMSGFGGAGAFSDGKYNITNDFGGTLYEYIGKKHALDLMQYVDTINMRYGGAGTKLYSTAGTKFKKLCIQNDLHLLPCLFQCAAECQTGADGIPIGVGVSCQRNRFRRQNPFHDFIKRVVCFFHSASLSLRSLSILLNNSSMWMAYSADSSSLKRSSGV